MKKFLISGLLFLFSYSANAAVLQAENFSTMSGIQTEVTTDIDGGNNVGWFDAGDWLQYTPVTIATTGIYTISFRVASIDSLGQFTFYDNDNPLFTLSVPQTGDWQKWTTAGKQATLTAGQHTFKIVTVSRSFNLNWFSYDLLVASQPAAALSTGLVITSSSIPSASSVSSSVVSSVVNTGPMVTSSVASSSVSSSKSSSVSSASSSIVSTGGGVGPINTSSVATTSSSSKSSSSSVASSSVSSCAPYTSCALTLPTLIRIDWKPPTERENGNPITVEEICCYDLRARDINNNTPWSASILPGSATSYIFTVPPAIQKSINRFELAVSDTNGLYSNFVIITPKDANAASSVQFSSSSAASSSSSSNSSITMSLPVQTSSSVSSPSSAQAKSSSSASSRKFIAAPTQGSIE